MIEKPKPSSENLYITQKVSLILFISVSLLCSCKKKETPSPTTPPSPQFIISTVAGNGVLGYSGDGGPALTAEFHYAASVAVDNKGDIFVADKGNNCIRKINSSGIITTVAGNGILGYSGDGGQATDAEFNAPYGVAVDDSGNIYIADQDNARIRKVNTKGIVTTFAGNGVSGYSGDGGLATAAQLRGPAGVTSYGNNIYIADYLGCTIRKVDTSGIISTIAGTGQFGFFGDGGPATAAEITTPSALALDNIGNLYIVDDGNYRIRMVDSKGIISTIAGNGTNGYAGDGKAATSAEFSYPTGIAVDPSGNVYIVDAGNSRIRKINTNGIISTIAGTGVAGYSGDGLAATMAEINSPWAVTLDKSGNIYIGDFSNNRVRKLTFQ